MHGLCTLLGDEGWGLVAFCFALACIQREDLNTASAPLPSPLNILQSHPTHGHSAQCTPD